jgi:hypothetical protein
MDLPAQGNVSNSHVPAWNVSRRQSTGTRGIRSCVGCSESSSHFHTFDVSKMVRNRQAAFFFFGIIHLAAVCKSKSSSGFGKSGIYEGYNGATTEDVEGLRDKAERHYIDACISLKLSDTTTHHVVLVEVGIVTYNASSGSAILSHDIIRVLDPRPSRRVPDHHDFDSCTATRPRWPLQCGSVRGAGARPIKWTEWILGT